jgi:hypothetical protein
VGYIIDLAEITIPGGVIRIDRSRLAFEHELTLGHYGLPHFDGRRATVRQSSEHGRRVITAAIRGRRLALIAYRGWDEVASRVHAGRNAEADESTVLYAHRKRTAKNPAMELMITALLHRRDDDEWTEEELQPVRGIKVIEVTPTGSILGAALTLSSGETYSIDFKEIDGRRSC